MSLVDEEAAKAQWIKAIAEDARQQPPPAYTEEQRAFLAELDKEVADAARQADVWSGVTILLRAVRERLAK